MNIKTIVSNDSNDAYVVGFNEVLLLQRSIFFCSRDDIFVIYPSRLLLYHASSISTLFLKRQMKIRYIFTFVCTTYFSDFSIIYT